MNETIRLIAQRYSCRAYETRLPERSMLDAIALAAVQAPSAMNRQPWQIVVITDKGFIEEMDADGMRQLAAAEDPSAYERIMDRGGKLYYGAPCMFLILAQPDTGVDTGIVSENIALAAASLGLGSVVCGMAAIPFKGPNGDAFKRRAGFPEGWDFGMAVLVGHAKGTGAPHQPDTSKIRFVE